MHSQWPTITDPTSTLKYWAIKYMPYFGRLLSGVIIYAPSLSVIVMTSYTHRLCLSVLAMMSCIPSISSWTVKKRGVLPNPQKRFLRFLKASKEDHSLKKRIKKSTKPLKVLSVYPREEPSPTKPFFKFRTGEKGLYKTFRVLYYTLMVSC
jgi:hypothetical protein